MTIKVFIQLLKRNFLLMLAGGLLTASAAYWLVSKQKQEFQSEAVVATGIISSVTIKNTGETKSADRDYAQNELENLISLATAHQTREKLADRLLSAYLLLNGPNPKWISEAEYSFLHDELWEPEVRALRADDFATTLARVKAAREADATHPVQELIYSDAAYFGIDYLAEHLQVYRKGNSDLLQFNYHTTDAAICQQTLNLLLDLFMAEHARLKKGQSSEVTGFFAEETQKSRQRLKAAESQLLAFRVQNNIINYEEQTRTIAIRKEDLDELRFKEQMNLQGTQATRARVEAELGDKNQLGALNQALLSLREELSQVSVQLAKLEIAPEGEDQLGQVARKGELEARQKQLQARMSQYAQEAYDFEESPGGMQKQKLLDEWLTTVVAEEQATARMGVIDNRTREFADIYGQYAPWGSRLKELQREINLAEEEYLANLHSYNQAILHQQHTLMATNLELIDSPYLPTAKPDFKKFLLVILGFMGGVFLVLVSLIALAFLDDSLKTPEVVRDKTGLDVATVLPNMVEVGQQKALRPQHEAARRQAMALLLQQIKVETLQKDVQPKLILVASTRPEEGKTWIAEQAANFLRAEDNKVLWLHPVEGGVLPANRAKDNVGYELSSRMLDADNLKQLDLFAENVYFDDYHYVIMEIPALLSGKYPLPLLRQFDLVLLVCRANRGWEEADMQALRTLQRAGRSPIRVVLNGVSMETMESFMGELPAPGAEPQLIHKPKRSSEDFLVNKEN